MPFFDWTSAASGRFSRVRIPSNMPMLAHVKKCIFRQGPELVAGEYFQRDRLDLMNDTVERYTKTAIILHWLVALMIIAMLALGFWMHELPKDAPKTAAFDLFNWGIYTVTLPEPVSVRTFYFNLHKSIGVTLLAIILFRVFWRLTHAAPAFLNTMKGWEKTLADFGHKTLYVLMLVMPLSGFVMSVYSKFGIKWFGMPLVTGLDNPKLRDFFLAVHEITAWLLVALILLHVAAAIKHKVVDKDGVMKRMSLHG
jgi:cytochrome b561